MEYIKTHKHSHSFHFIKVFKLFVSPHTCSLPIATRQYFPVWPASVSSSGIVIPEHKRKKKSKVWNKVCFLSSTDRSFCVKCLLRRRDFSVKQISSEGLEVVTLSPFCQQSSWEMSTLCQLKVMCCRYWLRLSILWVQSHMFYWNMVESSPDSNVDLTGFTLILYGNAKDCLQLNSQSGNGHLMLLKLWGRLLWTC